ncbi:hypothetical protein GCM10020295_65360 [Streptomyces cinereospinus]
MVAPFVATLGGLACTGHDAIPLDGGALGLDGLPGGPGPGGVRIPGLGDVGDIGGLLPDRVGDLVEAETTAGFRVDMAPTLLGWAGRRAADRVAGLPPDSPAAWLWERCAGSSGRAV